jgi:PAS domain S-box-containing protein
LVECQQRFVDSRISQDRSESWLLSMRRFAGGHTMRLSTRFTIAMVALVLLTATAVGLLTYRNVVAIALPRGLDRIVTHARLIATVLDESLRGARADVIGFQAASAIESMAARGAGETDPTAKAIEAEAQNRLAMRFVAELTAKPDYAQFRVIGIADGGREIVRVDRSGPGGAIRVVPFNELQRKGDRDYFKAAVALPPDGVYVSPINLNQENGAFEIPFVPTLRTAAPIYKPDGKLFGIVIINVDLRPVFARIRADRLDGTTLYIVNGAGDYLLNPDPNREFSFEFGRRARVQGDFPGFAGLPTGDETPPQVLSDRSGARFGVGWASVRLAGGPKVIVIETMPYAHVIAAATAIRDPSLIAGLVAVLCALALAAGLARSLTSPLVQMTKAVTNFSGDGPIAMPVGGGAEIGVLADAFRHMAAESQAKTTALKREIEERRRIFDTSPDLILVTDRRGIIVRVSPSCEPILGFSPEEMIGRSATEFIYPEDLEPTRTEMRQARRGRITRNFGGRYVHKNGRVVSLDWTGVWSEAAQQHFFVGRDMTEQKLADERLREQKALLDSALNNMHHGLVMFDKDNRAVVINQTYIEMYRLSPAQAKPGCTMRDLLEQRTANGTFSGDIDGYIETLRVQDHDLDRIFNSPDGRSIRVVNRAMSDGGWVSTHEDVTRQQKDEAEIRNYAEREKLFIAAVESSNDAIVTKSLDGVITGWNKAAERLFGYSSQEAIGNGIDIIVPKELRSEVWTILTKIKAGDKVDHHETVRVHKDGHRIDVSLSVSPVKSPSGTIIGAAKVARDITARKRAQEALRESEQMARDIIAGSLDGFVQIDESGKVIEWNPQAEVIFGWSREEALGKRLTELYLPKDFETHNHAMAARLKAPGGSAKDGERFEYEAVRKDGRKIRVEAALTPLQRRDGYVFNGFVRDITEKMAAEEQLKHAQKMESVGQLTGGVAHDFNNMLTVITGTIDILAEAVSDKPQLAAIARLISEAADRGAELTGHLLAFARRQPLQPRETDVNALLLEAEKLLRPTLGEHIDVKIILQEDAWSALVDPSQLSSALLNLAINARDAMPDGGMLMVETRNVVLDEAYAKINPDVQPGSYVLVAVSDTGTGIPETIRDRIFEPFFTTKGVGKGTGLGLSMVYGFIKQSGGHIKVYSEEGHGTTFKIYLPRAGAEPELIPTVSPSSGIEGGSETILVVEDDALVRTSVIAQIKGLGYHTLAAANAAEALAFADSGAPFDLLFTDVIMPGKLNGRQLADEMAKRRSPLKVLFTSGYTENAIIHHGRLDPGVLLLAKPYRKSDLARMIRKALDGANVSPLSGDQALKAQSS